MNELRVIVVGGGRVGLQTARRLDGLGHHVTLVERDEARCRDLTDEYVATVVEGDGTDPDILEQAGVESADVVAALTGDTGRNVGVCLLARRYGDARTVLRVEALGSRERYGELVDSVVYPERLGAMAAIDEILGQDVRALSDATDGVSVFTVEVTDDAPVAGRTLNEVALPQGSLVVSDENGDRIADAETTLAAGKRYLVAVEPDVEEELMQLFRG